MCLEPSIAVARNFVTEGPTLDAFVAALRAAESTSSSPSPLLSKPPTASSVGAAAAVPTAAAAARAAASLLRAAAPATSIAGVQIARAEDTTDPRDDPSVDIYEVRAAPAAWLLSCVAAGAGHHQRPCAAARRSSLALNPVLCSVSFPWVPTVSFFAAGGATPQAGERILQVRAGP